MTQKGNASTDASYLGAPKENAGDPALGKFRAKIVGFWDIDDEEAVEMSADWTTTDDSSTVQDTASRPSRSSAVEEHPLHGAGGVSFPTRRADDVWESEWDDEESSSGVVAPPLHEGGGSVRRRGTRKSAETRESAPESAALCGVAAVAASFSSEGAVRDGGPVTEEDEDETAAAAADFDELRALLPALRRAAALTPSSFRRRSASTTRTTGHQKPFFVQSVVQYSSGSSHGDMFAGDEDSTAGVRLPTDMYGLMYYAPPRHQAFLLAVCTFTFQMTILMLIFADVVGSQKIVLPAGVSGTVRASQFFAILVAVATQDDLITAINTVHLGYSHVFIRDDTDEKEKGGSKWQWIFSLLLRGTQGAFCLAVTFILIMQSREATAMFIDFLAVMFVSGIDDSVFLLARSGFFGGANKHKSGEMLRVRVPRNRKETYFFRPMIFIILSAAMLTGWGIIGHRQKQGQYLSCRNIMIQFGDDLHSTLGFLSSVFLFSRMDISGRPIYTSKQDRNQMFDSQISYCDELKAWTVTRLDSGSEPDPCDWAAITTESEAYDIMNIEPSDWMVYLRNTEGSKRGVPFQHFAMRCNGCEDSTQASCEEEGVCVNNECSCFNGWFGLTCQFRNPCKDIEVSTDPAGSWKPERWAGMYRILRQKGGLAPVIINERPVYVEEVEDDRNKVKMLQVIVFTGRRWFFTTSHSMMNATTSVSENDLAEFLSAGFQGHWADFDPQMVSSPVDLLTPSDKPDPTGLNWFHPESYGRVQQERHSTANLSPTTTRTLCSACDDELHPCENDGVCTTNGTCACPVGTYGTRCQVSSFDLCTSFEVSFIEGDETFDYNGGIYDLSNRSVGYMPVYVGRDSQSGTFIYCFRGRFWTLVLESDFEDPCTGWYGRSPRSFQYDILRSTGWVMPKSTNGSELILISSHLSSKVTCNDVYGE